MLADKLAVREDVISRTTRVKTVLLLGVYSKNGNRGSQPMCNRGVPGCPLDIQRLQLFRHFIEIRNQVIDLSQPGTGAE